VYKRQVEKATCGLYVEPENMDDIVHKLRETINDSHRLIKQGQNGYEYAKKYFDREVLAQLYVNHLKTIAR